MYSADRALDHLAAQQFSTFSRAQAHACGLSNKQIRQRVSARRWTLLHHGAFRLTGAPASPESEIAAAVMAMPTSWISHQAAAFMWDRQFSCDPTPAITRTHGHGQQLEGVRLHQSSELPPHHITLLGKLPITTRARTAFDLAAELDDSRVGRFIDDQIVQRRLRLGQVDRVFHDLAGIGRPGSARMARVLDRRVGTPPTESELEDRFSALCERRGLPLGTRQFPCPWTDSVASDERVDFAHLDERLIVEVDGRRYHAQLDAWTRDRRRDQLAVAAGWRTLRFTWFQIEREPAFVASIMRSSLGLDRQCAR